jgi:hypothetical protein
MHMLLAASCHQYNRSTAALLAAHSQRQFALDISATVHVRRQCSKYCIPYLIGLCEWVPYLQTDVLSERTAGMLCCMLHGASWQHCIPISVHDLPWRSTCHQHTEQCQGFGESLCFKTPGRETLRKHYLFVRMQQASRILHTCSL